MVIVVEPIQAAIWNCINHYDFPDAIFLAERLRAEIDTEETLFLLATCYYRAGKRSQAYAALTEIDNLSSSRAKYLFAKCCLDLGRISQAEQILTGGNRNKYSTEEDVIKDYGEESPFVLQLLAQIYYKTERTSDGVKAYRQSLKINPMLWHSFQDLCTHGEKENPEELFVKSTFDKYKILNLPTARTGIAASYNLGAVLSNNDKKNGNNGTEMAESKEENPVITNSTPMQPLSNIVTSNAYLLSGVREITPERYYPFVTSFKEDVTKTGNKERSTYGFSPFAASFGVMPLDPTSPSGMSFSSSPVNSALVAPVNTASDVTGQRVVKKRLLGGKDIVTPLQVSKPVFNQSGNVGKTLNVPPPPLKRPEVRRSSRVISNLNYSVKENSKSPNTKFITPKSPSRKSKLGRKSKLTKSSIKKEEEVKPKTETPPADTKPEKQSSQDILKKRQQQLLELQDQSVEGLLSLYRKIGKGYLHLCQFEMSKSIECFHSLPEHHRKTGSVLIWVGQAYMELHEYKKAIEYFRLVHVQEPYKVGGMELYSTALWHLHKEEELSYVAHNVMRHDRQDASAWCVAGNCMSLQKEHDVAVKFFQRAIQLNPRLVYAYTLLGHEYIVTEDLEKALDSFRSAIFVQPRHYNAWFGIGSIYAKQEKYSLAEFYFKKAFSIHPNSSIIMCHIGVVRYTMGRMQSALEILNKALAINPQNVLCKFHRASLYFATGGYEQALTELRDLTALAPKEPLIYYLMGKVHKKLGNDHLALMCFNWATDLDPKGTNTHVRDENAGGMFAYTINDVGNADGFNIEDVPDRSPDAEQAPPSDQPSSH